MSILEGLGLEFEEPMSGHIGVGETDPKAGLKKGREEETPLSFEVKISIPHLLPFLHVSSHEASLSGTVTFDPLGGTFPIRDGRFNLFSVDPETGMRQMIYQFRFTAEDGQTYYLHGHKEIVDDPGSIDVADDMTRLYTVIYKGEDENAPVYGAGQIFFHLQNAPALATSIRITGNPTFWQEVAARTAFVSFAWGALRDEYLANLRLLYDTRYENLVLDGRGQSGGEQREFFLITGEHDKGFPWGDGEAFWDLLLVVQDPGGNYRRYAITNRVLEGLDLNLADGTCRYRGPIYELQEGYGSSFSRMDSEGPGIVPRIADLEIEFDTGTPETTSFPFARIGKLVRKLASGMAREIDEVFSSERTPGVHITPRTVSVRSGRISIVVPDAPEEPVLDLEMDPDDTFGEAEQGEFRNFKEPTLLYGYLCGLREESKTARVQIHSRTLRNERPDWGKDQLDRVLGEVLSRKASGEMLVSPDGVQYTSLDPHKESGSPEHLLQKQGAPLLEVRNDHYPTAVFIRRIVRVKDPDGEECLALEEDMDPMRLEPIASEERVKVAAFEGEDRFELLDRVLEETGFMYQVERAREKSGKEAENFLVAIKPNFMFAYDRNDHTTYTDPSLVKHLARKLQERGYTNLAVVEAHSTYGEHFTKRSVAELCDYLGFRSDLYRVVDLTEEAVESQEIGPELGTHPVSPTWRDADFRISFAKNKTHAYTFYTLALKNIYGTLPMGNKFKEYHCNRNIYRASVEWMAAFPVHYALIDAFVSADGPFGVFADTRPNHTRTIIGGASPVAVDWVGASKMGIDPMISQYMSHAVEEFGKPEIELVGSAEPYRPWLNVPAAMSLFTNKGLDSNYFFGNLFYTACAQMDETHFEHKNKSWYIRLLRRVTNPLRRAFFLRTGENPSWLNRFFAWLFYKLGKVA
jgi:uncharacterized protein (DUF362 family)